MNQELRRNEWVTIGQAAQRLGVEETRVRQWIHRNKTAVARKGRLVLYLHVEEIEARMRQVAS